MSTSPVAMTDEATSPKSPVSLSSHGPSSANGLPMATSTLLLRRATPAQRLVVDRGLLDVFSDSCAQARSKAQLHHALFLPNAPRGHEMRDRLSMRESTMLRRRKSFLDSRARTQSMDIAFTGEVKGSIMDRPKSMGGTKRASQSGHARGHTEPPSTVTSPVRKMSHDTGADETPSTDLDADNADDAATAGGTSDFGTLRGREHGTFTRTTSVASVSPGPASRPLNRRSLSLFRPSFEVFGSTRPSAPPAPADAKQESMVQKSVRRTASAMNMSQRAKQGVSKAKSTPASPERRARQIKDGAEPHKVHRASSDPQRLEHTEHQRDQDLDISPNVVLTPDTAAQSTFDDAQPVYARGQGLTNTPDLNRNSWSGSIRRGVSMLKSRGNSSANLVELGSGMSSSVTGLGLSTGPGGEIVNGTPTSGSGSGSGSSGIIDFGPEQPGLSSSTSGSSLAQREEVTMTPPPPVKRSNSSLFLSHLGVGSKVPEQRQVAVDDDDDRDKVETTPRRRKSVKLLQTLRGFTPM